MAYGFNDDKSKVDVYSKEELEFAKWHIDPSIVPYVIRDDAVLLPIKYLPDESLVDKEIVEVINAKAVGMMNRPDATDKATDIEIISWDIRSDKAITVYVTNNTGYEITINDTTKVFTFISGIVRQL